MRHLFFTFVFFSITVISCDKDSAGNFKDKIVYQDLSPDLILHPVDSQGFHPSGFCQEIIPFPSDSTVIVDLDINHDGDYDFRFTYSTFFELVSASSPCANYNSVLHVKGLSAEEKIKVANEDMREISILEKGDFIEADQLYANHAIIYRDNEMAFLYFGAFAGEGFIGIKLSGGELGWIKLNFQKDSFLCTIMEYGYNEAINSEIMAGQKE